MKPNLITVACLLLALVCYVAGFSTPGNALIVAGVLFELVFWFRLFRGDRRETSG